MGEANGGAVYVCILTWNRLEKVRQCIESIWPDVEGAGAQLMILDQGSNDGTRGWLNHWVQLNRWDVLQRKVKCKKPIFWESWQNFKAIGGRQRQADRLIGTGLQANDIIVFLDSDVKVVREGWLQGLIEPIIADDTIGMSGAYGMNIAPDWGGFVAPLTVPSFVSVLGGGMTAVRGAVFLEGCEFDQSFLPFWHADSDLCFQAREKGYRIWHCGDVGLVHEAEHKNSDSIYDRNWERLRKKWE